MGMQKKNYRQIQNILRESRSEIKLIQKGINPIYIRANDCLGETKTKRTCEKVSLKLVGRGDTLEKILAEGE